jgi:ubiquitin-protein ligase
MSKNTLKRILNKDIKSVTENGLEKLGIYIDFNEENLLEAKAMIVGPKGGIYEGGVFFFKILFPKNYPYSPPDICYISINRIRIHPNLYTRHHKTGHGKICLSILGTWNGPSWTTVMDISTVLLTIQSLLDENPLLHEPGITNKTFINNYNKIIEHENIKTLYLKNSFHIPIGFEYFKDLVKENMDNHKAIIYEKIIKNVNIKGEIKLSLYNLNYTIDYKNLKDLYDNYIKI